MEITEAQYQSIASSLPRQRGNVKLNNLQLLGALLYVPSTAASGAACPSASEIGIPSTPA
jgi:hypothetical protein